MLSRREVLRSAPLVALAGACARLPLKPSPRPVALNDIHSQLNETTVDRVVPIDSVDAILRALADARREGKQVSIAGGRHAMGGQQFGAGTINLDMRPYKRVLQLDAARGLVEIESGVEWPDLIGSLLKMQQGSPRVWSIAQKQTGADRLTVGGAISANAHGRGLTMPPMVHDVEAFTLVDASGKVLRCSRDENRELFSLVIGGYGLFGVIATITLRLKPRVKVRRVVEVRGIDGLMDAVSARIADGFLYGDFQFSIDEKSPKFLREGVFSCYKPVEDSVAETAQAIELSDEQWTQLFALAHFDKPRAYDLYTKHYLSTNGQVYWSDTHQLSVYIDDYHKAIDAHAGTTGSEMITEIYVPRPRLADFMEAARAELLASGANLFYGTIRFIERDEETFLPWAKQPYACVVFNLHVDHTQDGIRQAADVFRRLIDLGIARDGSYYLTYHRWARRDQVERCYPQFASFLGRKRRFDPEERFQSEWYRHYAKMFS